MTNEQRIDSLAQDIYLARHSQYNDVDGDDLIEFRNATIGWINQFIPELERARDSARKVVDWNFVRTNNDIIGTVVDAGVISYPLPAGIRKLVINPHRDLTIRHDNTVVSTFTLVNPNQSGDPTDVSTRDRATVIQRKVIFSRPLRDTEVTGDIVADTIAKIPMLSTLDVALLDILDENPDIRQLFVMGVVKNQILPDIVQGGLTPSYAQKFDRYLADCIMDNNDSADADDAERESFANVGGVGF